MEGLNSVLDSRDTQHYRIARLLEAAVTLGRDSTLVVFYALIPTKPRHLDPIFFILL